MNSDNVDTEPSLQMHKLASVLFFSGGGGGGGLGGAGYTFFGRGVGGSRVHSAQVTTQFVDHKPERATIID